MGQELLGRLRQTLDLVQGAEAEALRLAVALRHGGGTLAEIAEAVDGCNVLRCERVRLLRELSRLDEHE